MRILVIDEEAGDRERIVRVLEQALDAPLWVGVEDLDSYRRALGGEAVDLVLTEYALGWMDGFGVLRDIRARWPTVPVILVTGAGSETLAVEGLQAGLSHYVPKAHLERLAPAVQDVLARPALPLPTLANALLDALGTPVSYIDANLIYRYCNAEAARHLGRPVDQIVGRPLQEVVPANPAIWQAVTEVLETGHPYERQVRFTWADRPNLGEQIYQIAYKPHKNAQGEVIGCFNEGTNVTARVLADEERVLLDEERAVQDEERALVDEERVLVDEERAVEDEERVLVDEERAVEAEERVLLDEERARVNGERARVNGERAREDDERAREGEERERLVQDLQARTVELLQMNATQQEQAIALEEQTVELEEQAAQMAEQNEMLLRIETALRESQALYRAIARHFPDGAIFAFDHDLRYRVADGASLGALGFTREGLEGRTIWEALDVETGRTLEQRYMRVLAGESLHFENAFKGQVFTSDYVPVRDEAGEIIAGMVVSHDVTERKRTEEQLRRYAADMAQLNEHNRLLLREVDHRVKNNLTAIMGLIYAVQHQLDRETDASDMHTRYQAALGDLSDRVRSLAMVHGLLSAGGWRPLSLTDLTEKVIRTLVPAAESEDVVQVVEIAGPEIQVTPEQAHSLALVIGELTTNTLKYGQTQDGLHITVKAALDDGSVRVVYRNQGPGYPAPVLEGQARSVGLGLVHILVTHNLRGTWSLCNDGGAVTEILFPIASPRASARGDAT